MIRIKIPTLRNPQLLITSLLISVILSSCATLSNIDNAQDEFNKGAEIENAAIFKQFIPVVTPPESADFYYKRAYGEVKEALAKSGKLEEFDLLVNAYTLKSLCEWKLKSYNQAIKTASVGLLKISSPDDYPRDYAVLSSMSALIGIEQADSLQESYFRADSIASKEGIAAYQKLIRKDSSDKKDIGKIEKALFDLNKFSEEISQKHDVQTYLLMSKLAALKVWDDALEAVWNIMDLNDENNAWHAKEEKALNQEIKKYGKALATILGDDYGDHPVYKYWNRLLHFPDE